MGQAEREKKQFRRAKIRLRRIRHNEQMTKNISQTCRFFAISRGQFYFWLRRSRVQPRPTAPGSRAKDTGRTSLRTSHSVGTCSGDGLTSTATDWGTRGWP